MKAKKRVIYTNELNLVEAEENLKEIGCKDITDNDILDEAVFLSQIWHDDEMERILEAFPGKVIARGTVERWTGVNPGGALYNNFSAFQTDFLEDCDDYEFYDKNGHFFVRGTHHDGTNVCEIKPVTQLGEEYYDAWYYDVASIRRCGDKEYDVIMKMFNSSKYSHVPNFAHKFYGCKLREYEMEA